MLFRSTVPKPLIEKNGKPLIRHAVETLDISGRYIFIVQKEHREKYDLDHILYNIKRDSLIIETDVITEGPACSALLAKDYIDNNEELIIANCDQIMQWNGLLFMDVARNYDGCVVTYHNSNTKNSFAKINKYGLVTDIQEKKAISEIALVGIHYWKNGKYFVDSAKKMIANNDRCNNEFYVGSTYNYMIKDNLQVGIYHVPNQQYIPVGTPEDFETYLKVMDK